MKTGRIFADSGGWIAMVDNNDDHHVIAVDYYRRVASLGLTIVTSDFVLDEAITRIRYDAGHPRTQKFINGIHGALETGILRVERVDSDLWTRAETILATFRDVKLSFTDCTSFALLQQIEVDEVFGFDSHFEMMGHVLVPK